MYWSDVCLYNIYIYTCYVWHHFVLRLQSVLMIKNHLHLTCIQGTPGIWPAPLEVASPWRQRDLFLPKFWDKEESQTTWNILKYPEMVRFSHIQKHHFSGPFLTVHLHPCPSRPECKSSGSASLDSSHPPAEWRYTTSTKEELATGLVVEPNPLETYPKNGNLPQFLRWICFETTTQLCHFFMFFVRFGVAGFGHQRYWMISIWSVCFEHPVVVDPWFKSTATVARFLIFPISRMSFTTNLTNYWNERRVEAQSQLPLNCLAKLWYFTNLDFPEIRGLSLLNHHLRWGRVRSL